MAADAGCATGPSRHTRDRRREGDDQQQVSPRRSCDQSLGRRGGELHRLSTRPAAIWRANPNKACFIVVLPSQMPGPGHAGTKKHSCGGMGTAGTHSCARRVTRQLRRESNPLV